MHENRETSEVPEANFRDRPAGEGKSRTARMHAFEESDSGTVPMNHSNKSGKPQAESEEGRRVSSKRLACSVGDRPTGVRVRNPVAWIAGGKETELLEPIDKAIFKDGEQVTGP